MIDIHKKAVNATKWSSLTEFASKLVSPLSTMVLARALTPEAFGVFVTATMVISFAEIFTDAGFQKYIVQHEFSDKSQLYKATNVAFWSNLCLSLAIWLLIIIFSENIAELVGNKGYGNVISVSCFCIPLAAFSSLQMAIFRRDFDYKTLFVVRMVGIAIPVVITIPLAFLLRSYWALIWGMVGLNLSNAILLTIKSSWKPSFNYSFSLLREMFSFTVWSMFETLAIWMTGYIDIFIVGRLLNDYYLGIYRTSMSTVGQIMGLVTAATTTVLFSALSRFQNNKVEFENTFFKFQKIVGLFVIPLGFGIFLFRDFIVEILLGKQWVEAAHFIGLWGLTSSITIVLSHYCSEVYRATGKPKLSFIMQLQHLAFIIPAVYISIGYGFDILCDTRAWIRMEGIIANLICMSLVIGISSYKMIRNIMPELFAALIMFTVVYFLPNPESTLWTIGHILIASIIYFGVIFFFPKERYILLNLRKIIKR